eukprot:529337_1
MSLCTRDLKFISSNAYDRYLPWSNWQCRGCDSVYSPGEARCATCLTDGPRLRVIGQLCAGDEVDHRDGSGWFRLSVIKGKDNTKLKIHYVGWSSKHDTWSDYEAELYRFAMANSVSKRPPNRLTHLVCGDRVLINPPRHPEWKISTIRQIPIDNRYTSRRFCFFACP